MLLYLVQLYIIFFLTRVQILNFTELLSKNGVKFSDTVVKKYETWFSVVWQTKRSKLFYCRSVYLRKQRGELLAENVANKELKYYKFASKMF